MKSSTYLQIENAIRKEKEQKKVKKIDVLIAVAVICVVFLLLGVIALVIDLLSNQIIEYPIYYIVLLIVIIAVLVLFSLYALPNNDFSAKEAEILERGRLRRHEFSLFKALDRDDYDSLKDFKITSKEQLLEIIDGLTEMDQNYLEQFSPYATIPPPVEMPEAVITTHTRRDVLTRRQEREKVHWQIQPLD